MNGMSVFSAASATASAAAATNACFFLASTLAAGCFVGEFLGGGGWRAGCTLARGVSSSRGCSPLRRLWCGGEEGAAAQGRGPLPVVGGGAGAGWTWLV